MNIYWFELFLRVMQGDIGDTGWGGVGGGLCGKELGKQLSLIIVVSVPTGVGNCSK